MATNLKIIARPAGDIIVTQVGTDIHVNGARADIAFVATIQANPRHYLRNLLPAVLNANASAFAIVLTQIEGKAAQIALTAEQYALGADERAAGDATIKSSAAAMLAAEDRDPTIRTARYMAREERNERRNGN